MESMSKLAILLLATVLVNGQARWQNDYDQPLNFNCPHQQSISSIRSQHNNHHEDRVWDFSCQATFSSSPSCMTSPYVNDFDQQFNYRCPNDYVITGMNSYHNNHHEDRRWQFTCCRANNFCTAHCQWTPYVNYFDEAFNWQVPHGYFLVGAESYHQNKQEDRRWKYYYCAKVPC